MMFLKKKLRKALLLYELAYAVLSTEDIQATVFHQMAIVNNIGQIHAILQNVECSRRTFDDLLSIIMLVKDQQVMLVKDQEVSEEDYGQDMDGFLSNTLMNTGCTFAAAA
jgi:hypothetical protein